MFYCRLYIQNWRNLGENNFAQLNLIYLGLIRQLLDLTTDLVGMDDRKTFTNMQDVSFDIASPVRNTLMDFNDSLFWRTPTPNPEGLAATSTSRPSGTVSDGSTGLKPSSSTAPSNVSDSLPSTSSAVTVSEHSKFNYLSSAEPSVASTLRGE